MTFEWDDDKAEANRRKHGVTFKEAETVWWDPNPLIDPDVAHSNEQEDRWSILGLSDKFRLLLVIFTERNEAIRIISARRANQGETERYAAQS